MAACFLLKISRWCIVTPKNQNHLKAQNRLQGGDFRRVEPLRSAPLGDGDGGGGGHAARRRGGRRHGARGRRRRAARTGKGASNSIDICVVPEPILNLQGVPSPQFLYSVDITFGCAPSQLGQ